MLSLKNSLAVLRKTDALLEGHFVLSSGLHSPQYVQCAKLLSKPTHAKKFISSLATKIKRNKLEQLRALDNNININVALANKSPIGVDSKEDYLAIKKIMKYK